MLPGSAVGPRAPSLTSRVFACAVLLRGAESNDATCPRPFPVPHRPLIADGTSQGLSNTPTALSLVSLAIPNRACQRCRTSPSMRARLSYNPDVYRSGTIRGLDVALYLYQSTAPGFTGCSAT